MPRSLVDCCFLHVMPRANDHAQPTLLLNHARRLCLACTQTKAAMSTMMMITNIARNAGLSDGWCMNERVSE